MKDLIWFASVKAFVIIVSTFRRNRTFTSAANWVMPIHFKIIKDEIFYGHTFVCVSVSFNTLWGFS